MRISVTDLDSWLYFQSSEMGVETLLRRLRHEEPPNIQMRAGAAFHKILERASSGEASLGESIEIAQANGFTFRFAVDASLPALPVCELKGELELVTASGPVTLVGKVDGIDGAIYDHKLTKRFDAERHADSYQWRSYLVMFGATKFTYNVFIGKEENGEWLVSGFERFTLYTYEGMREDVVEKVGALAEFIARYMPERA